MWRLLCLQAFFFLSYLSHAQTIPSGSVPLQLDEFGKGELTRFAVQKGKPYSFEITVAKPQKQHKAFLQKLSRKLEMTYDALQSGPHRAIYTLLWSTGELDTLSRECLALANLLKRPDARSKLAALPADSFPNFFKRDFLLEVLFDSAFVISHDMKDIKKGRYDGPLTLEKNIASASGDTLSIKVFVKDFEKHFTQQFFEKSKHMAPRDSFGRPQAFYAKMERLHGLNMRFDSLRLDFLALPKAFVCDTSIIDRYEELLRVFDANPEVQSLQTGWMKTWTLKWIWNQSGLITLNPMGFTEEDRLPYRYGYDTSKARLYNEYRNSALTQMIQQQELSGGKDDYRAFDSLLLQKDRGAEKFSYRLANGAFQASNKDAAEQQQMLWRNLNTIKLVVLDPKKEHQYIYRYFDAGNELKGTKPQDDPALSNKQKIALAVYNLQAGDTWTVQAKAEEIKNEPQLITDINEVTDLLGGGLGAAGPLQKVLDAFVGSYRSPYPTTALPTTIPASLLRDGISAKESNQRKSGSPKADSINLLTSQYLWIAKIENCPLFNNLLAGRIIAVADSLNLPANITALGEYFKREAEALLRQYAKASYIDELLKRIAVLELMASPSFYTLPPDSLSPGGSKIPEVRNELQLVKEDTKAVKKELDIVLSNAKTGKEIARVKDSYKTAPATRWTASVGATWIMTPFKRQELKMEGGLVTGTTDDNQLRVLAGLHWHLAPLIQADNRPIWKLPSYRFWKKEGEAFTSRFSLFAGVSFPKPFYNLHPGIGTDLVPGVKVVTTAHFYRFTNYTLMNGQITDESSKMVYNGLSVGISLVPLTFVKLIGIIK